MALVRQAYAEARQLLEKSVAIYRQVGPRDEEGLALAELGCAMRALGHLAQARQVLCEALLAASESRARAPALFSVAHTALLLADQGEPERAVELYTLASRYPYLGHSRLGLGIDFRAKSQYTTHLSNQAMKGIHNAHIP